MSAELDYPTLNTPRLKLSLIGYDSAATLAALADDPLIAAFTVNLPSPYTLADAQKFIGTMHVSFEERRALAFGVYRKADNALMGVISLALISSHCTGHLAYWLGADYRGQGYMSEAAVEIMQYGFKQLKLHRIQSRCLKRNLPSARVLRKAGLQDEGLMVESFLKEGVFHDQLLFGVLSRAWNFTR
ncbi:GNAT family N-acetyltransferase [Pseudomonas syringae]|nr:GNAT family N-acetyltransferase [Pseudomonas syringae]